MSFVNLWMLFLSEILAYLMKKMGSTQTEMKERLATWSSDSFLIR